MSRGLWKSFASTAARLSHGRDTVLVETNFLPVFFNPPSANFSTRFPREARQTVWELRPAYSSANMDSAKSLTLRLDALPRSELVALLADGCAASPDLRHKADALINKHKPLPGWCTELLSSEDMLPAVLDSLRLCDVPVASVCTVWAAAWRTLLVRRRLLQLVPLVSLEVPGTMGDCFNFTMLPTGLACVSTYDGVSFVSVWGDELPTEGAWAALETAAPDPKPLYGEMSPRIPCVLLHEDFLFVGSGYSNPHSDTGRVRKLRLSDGAEVAHSAPRDDQTALTQIALSGSRLFVLCFRHIGVLDANTLEWQFNFGDLAVACDLAISGDEVYVADSEYPGKLLVFGTDGTPLRTLEGDFGTPVALTISHENVYVLESAPDERVRDLEDFPWRPPKTYNEWHGHRIVVLDHLHGTTQIQDARADGSVIPDPHRKVQVMSTKHVLCLPGPGDLTAVHVHGDELFVAHGFGPINQMAQEKHPDDYEAVASIQVYANPS